MNKSKDAKVLRSLSSSVLIRNYPQCRRKSLPNDPFLKIFTMFSKTPALKPTCHRTLASQQQLTKPRIIWHKPKHLQITDPSKITSNIFNTNASVTPHKTLNPAFSEKHSDKKFKFVDFDQIKTIFRGSENPGRERTTLVEKAKIPSFEEKIIE